ncbi:sensor histidine kinase [Nonomuraea monospora]|uniref:sensor histidine kinase n=1 Tax=Nonomuraea monospora TaxID=568818 RepID=UPI0031DE2038
MTGLVRVSFYSVVQEFNALTVACVAVVAVLQVPISLPGRRRLSVVLFLVQVVVNYLPLLAEPERWEVGGSGFVAASALLVVNGPFAWVILGLIAAVEGVIALAMERLPYMVYYAIVAPINVGLMVYGISSLAGLVDQVKREREELAARAGAVERLRLWGRIHGLVVRNVGVVERLTREAREAWAAREADSWKAEKAEKAEKAGAQEAGKAEKAGAQEAGEAGRRGGVAAVREAVRAVLALAREALGRVRALPPADEAIPVPPRDDDRRILRLATPILVVTHVLFIGQALFYFVADAPRGPAFTHAGYLLLLPLTFGLQFWHLAVLRSGVRPRMLVWTLVAHALAIYAPLVNGEGSGLLASGFFAGVLLLYLPWRVAWPLCVVMSGVAAVEEALASGLIAGVYPFASVMNTALAVYGLTRLVGLVGELSRTRAELVEVAALRERLKVGRDVHDLLGRGLTAIVLHAELVLRLVETESGRVGAQLERLAEAVRAALVDSVRLSASGRVLSLGSEIESARGVLEAAGVGVRIESVPARGMAVSGAGAVVSEVGADVPAHGTGAAAPVLAVVLREAVTNVLKHGTPHECVIELAVQNGHVQLRVTNDGAAPVQEVTSERADAHEPGSGLTNLRARLEAIGGTLTTTRTADRFELLARTPLDHENLTPAR